MPTEQRNPLIEFTKLLKEYQSLHNRKHTSEYTIENENDSQASIYNKFIKYLDAKIASSI